MAVVAVLVLAGIGVGAFFLIKKLKGKDTPPAQGQSVDNLVEKAKNGQL